MKQVRDVLKFHSVMNLSLRKIEGATGVAKSTISDYIKRFMASGRQRSRPSTKESLAVKMIKESTL